MAVELKRVSIPLKPAKRCSDFDSECAEVRNHAACWHGGPNQGVPAEWRNLGQADGYCPYLIGMLPKP